MRLSRSNSTRSESLLPTDSFRESNRGPSITDRLCARCERLWNAHHRLLVPIFLALFLVPIWISIGDHGFNGRSDARYAVVSMDMARTGEWLIPHYIGEVHLTKPPLVYWLQSASISVLGHTFYAVRLPSAISGTLAILLLFWFARRVASTRVALFAAGLYAVMPLTILPSRMTVTDSIVNLFWMAMLFAGYLRAQSPGRWRWSVVLWGAASLGILAKGPVLFIPIGIVGLWWLLIRREHGATSSALRFFVGFMLAMIPTLIWAYAVYLNEPNAVDIWVHETFDRAIGAGDHSRPIWFFLPIIFAGCFPASAMLLIPGVNLRWKDALTNLRTGTLEGYLGWSVIVPFVVFSLISGKLASYILPICAPLALLSAIMLERWFTQNKPVMESGRRMPEVRWGICIGTLLFILGIGGVVGYTYGTDKLIWLYGLGIAFGVSVVLVLKWDNRQFRVIGMSGFIGAWILGWAVLEELEDIAISQMSYVEIAKQTFGEPGWPGKTGVFQLEDGIIYWDRVGDLEFFDSSDQLHERLNHLIDEPILILTNAKSWDKLIETAGDLDDCCEIVNQWYQWPGAPKRYLVVCSPTSP
jgi:4-amino-4-deoxy-L-arabinose transferase-like glycosyltransferase